MNSIGTVVSTFSAKKGQSGLPRPQVAQLELLYNYGIKEDKFAGQDENRAVMVVGTIAYDVAKSNGIELEIGSLGENILFDFNPHEYNVGDILKVGQSYLQITQHCTICSHLAVFDKKLPKLVQNCRGLYCKILQGGLIKANMRVERVDNGPAQHISA